MKRLFLLAIMALVLAGCTSASFISHEATHATAKPDSYIVPIIDRDGPQPPPESYTVLGTAEGITEKATIPGKTEFAKDHMLEAIAVLRKEAAWNGADALLNVKIILGVSGLRTGKRVRATGTAIVFKNPDEAFKQLKEMGAIFK